MIRVVLTGHGTWASGAKAGLDMVAGERDCLQAVDFDGDTNSLTLRLKEVLDGTDPVFVFCDLAGGTPLQVAALTCRGRDNAWILAGASQPMLLEILPMLESGQDPADLMQTAMRAGHDGIRLLSLTGQK